MRVWIVILGMIVLGTSGCCAPMGCGFGCNALSGCYDCEGGFGPPRIPRGPVDGLRQAKRSLVCGRGCGEVYYGEWISTPPDCCDPCCGDQFVGGAVRCTPFCWEPGTLLRHLYGRRLCQCCDLPVDDCGCSDGGTIAAESAMHWESGAGQAGCDCHGSHTEFSAVSRRSVHPSSVGRMSAEMVTPERLPPRGMVSGSPMPPKRIEAAPRSSQQRVVR
ncbi:MAG TPA: hypothetical protein PKD54_13040 [Pirellulaceae bacterium]|nr:hypothetical protein [Pirellulaceae bacterium]